MSATSGHSNASQPRSGDALANLALERPARVLGVGAAAQRGRYPDDKSRNG